MIWTPSADGGPTSSCQTAAARNAADRAALCLACADLDHLAFLPRGDATLTRRARAHSTLSAVVLKWSRARKRYERPTN